jgi:hypothetical protein
MPANESQLEVNKVVRVVAGKKPLKYVVRILFDNGQEVETQSQTVPDTTFNSDTRQNWLQGRCSADYSGTYLICPVSRIVAIRVEENESAA